MGFLLRAFADSFIILGIFYLFVFSLPFFGINIFFESIFSNLGIFFSYILIFAEVLWNRV